VRTLCIDVGGSGIKALVADDEGEAVTERRRIETPRPATPEAVLAAILEVTEGHGAYDRVSVGFPGVVVDGVVRTAPNLDGDWSDVDLARELHHALGRPVRAANDAGVQGLGVVEGKGTEVVLTLGTGMGFGLYVDGVYVPNVELAHHPFRGEQTYEDRVSDEVRRDIGDKRWRKRVVQVVDQIVPIFNPRRVYLGGGNARLLDRDDFPECVTLVDNVAGLLGGVRLWDR
jgi:polyphosphate glucokinase